MTEKVCEFLEALEGYDGEAIYTMAENGNELAEAWLNICRICESRSDRQLALEGYFEDVHSDGRDSVQHGFIRCCECRRGDAAADS